MFHLITRSINLDTRMPLLFFSEQRRNIYIDRIIEEGLQLYKSWDSAKSASEVRTKTEHSNCVDIYTPKSPMDASVVRHTWAYEGAVGKAVY